MTETILRGLLIGLPLGFVFQRTRLCFNSAYRTALLQRDFTLIRMILVAVALQMVGLYALVASGLTPVQINAVPFQWLAAITGGLIFGVAMTYAEGCSSTVWYRVGNGNLGALVTLVGFAVGEALLSFGPLRPLRERVQASVIAPPSGLGTLPNFLGLSPWLLIVPLAALAIVLLWRAPRSAYLGGWGWLGGGLALGIIGVAAWAAAWPTGWHYGLGVVGATGPWLLAFARGPGVLNWGSYMVLAMPVGALAAALLRREFRWQVPNLPGTARMGLAGIVMGLSATLAGGCNIGHGLAGLPTLALSSIVATIFTFLGVAAGVYWRFVRPQPVALHIPAN